MKPYRRYTILLSLILVSIACGLTDQAGVKPDEPAGEATAAQEQADADGNPDPTTWELPPQSQAAEIRPEERRMELTHLSNLIGYQVLDQNGDELGVVKDYIVNTCETYIIYILMEPAARLHFEPGSRVVIPFEAVTINSGALDAEIGAIHLHLVPEQFSGAPTFPAEQPLTPTDWEGAVRNFWSEMVRIGVLATSCNVPGGPVYKVAYATELLGVDLYDGQGNLLGSVQEAILEPESGKVGFYVVKPAQGDGFVLVHLPATNIPEEALLPDSTLTLVLLVEPEVFWEAPRFNNIEDAGAVDLQSEMREYWEK